MKKELRPPIILFGNMRSGTTILQNVICTHPDVVKLYEPRTLWLYADPRRSHDEFDKSDATEPVKRYIRKQFIKYQIEHGNRTIMEKTPSNIMRIPYIREIFPEARFIFIVRNPLSFISSTELKWQKPLSMKGVVRRLRTTPIRQLHCYANRLVRDRYYKHVLGHKYLELWGTRYKGIDQDVKAEDLITVIARQWARCSEKAAKDLSAFDEGEVLQLKYEDFVEDPVFHLERICAHCGIDIKRNMVNYVRGNVKSDRHTKWHRFEPETLTKILPEIRNEMQRHGYEVPPELNEVMIPSESRK